eukprot:1517412-Rhodomonas_salina.2
MTTFASFLFSNSPGTDESWSRTGKPDAKDSNFRDLKDWKEYAASCTLTCLLPLLPRCVYAGRVHNGTLCAPSGTGTPLQHTPQYPCRDSVPAYMALASTDNPAAFSRGCSGGAIQPLLLVVLLLVILLLVATTSLSLERRFARVSGRSGYPRVCIPEYTCCRGCVPGYRYSGTPGTLWRPSLPSRETKKNLHFSTRSWLAVRTESGRYT